jgi:hypothetical protein
MEGGAATALLIGSTPRCWPGDHLVGMCGGYTASGMRVGATRR